MSNLNVNLGINLAPLHKGLKEGDKEIKAFGKKVKSSFSSGAKGIDKLTKSSVNAVPVTQELSRVIQDMPYGMQGVANNITQLVSQFGYLQKSAGGTQQALKSVISSFMGAGGMIFLVSTVTSLWVSFGDRLFQTKDKIKSLRDEQEKLNQSLDDYVFGLEATKKASLEGTKSAQKELVTLRLLRKQAENTNLSYDQRISAVKELQKKYPSYLANVDKEKILNGELSGTYKTLSKSILQRAKATASMNAIIKNSEQMLVLEDKIAIATKENEEAQLRYSNALARVEKGVGSLRNGGLELQSNLSRTKAKADETSKALNLLQGQLQNLELTNIDLESNIDVVTDTTTIQNKAKELAKAVVVGFNSELSGLSQPIVSTISSALGEGTAVIRKGSVEMINALTELSQGASNIINNNLVGAFSGIGNAIGSALSEGTNLGQSLAKVLLSSMGTVLTQLGQLAIAIGLGLTKIKLSLKSLNPALAIAGGVGLIALGKMFSSKASSIGNQFGGGGSTNTSTSTQTTTGGSFTSGFSGSGGGTVVFEIAGTKLIGVLSNTMRQNRNLGGTLRIN